MSLFAPFRNSDFTLRCLLVDWLEIEKLCFRSETVVTQRKHHVMFFTRLAGILNAPYKMRVTTLWNITLTKAILCSMLHFSAKLIILRENSYKIGGGRGSGGTSGKIKIQDLGKSIQDRMRGEGGQTILYGYKIANFPETLDHIP